MKWLLLPFACISLFSCKNNAAKNESSIKAESTPTAQEKVGVTDELSTDPKSPLSATGDLNKDGLADSAIVTQDTLAFSWPYNLKVFFRNMDGSYKLALSADSAIDASYPDGKDGYQQGNSFYQVTIEKGVLILEEELLRGSYQHKFRFQNNRFELIGFNAHISNGGGILTTVDFNLSTGRYITRHESYETDKVSSAFDTVVHIKPLPDLATFKPYSYHEGNIDF